MVRRDLAKILLATALACMPLKPASAASSDVSTALTEASKLLEKGGYTKAIEVINNVMSSGKVESGLAAKALLMRAEANEKLNRGAYAYADYNSALWIEGLSAADRKRAEEGQARVMKALGMDGGTPDKNSSTPSRKESSAAEKPAAASRDVAALAPPPEKERNAPAPASPPRAVPWKTAVQDSPSEQSSSSGGGIGGFLDSLFSSSSPSPAQSAAAAAPAPIAPRPAPVVSSAPPRAAQPPPAPIVVAAATPAPPPPAPTSHAAPPPAAPPPPAAEERRTYEPAYSSGGASRHTEPLSSGGVADYLNDLVFGAPSQPPPARPYALLESRSAPSANDASAAPYPRQSRALPQNAAQAQFAAAKAKASASGSFAIQLAALSEEDKAIAEADRLGKKYAADLGGRTPTMMVVPTSDGGTLYKIVAAPFDSRADGFAACDALKAKGVSCMVITKK